MNMAEIKFKKDKRDNTKTLSRFFLLGKESKYRTQLSRGKTLSHRGNIQNFFSDSRTACKDRSDQHQYGDQGLRGALYPTTKTARAKVFAPVTQ